jgi:glycerol-3-phosphate dehydrogenase subunit B
LLPTPISAYFGVVATELDVAILGSGIAGTTAAIAAARAGARVGVITGPPAATAMFSGAWNGPCPEALHQALVETGYHLRDVAHSLPHPNGRLLPCTAAAASHAAAKPEAAWIIGIAGLPGFNAPILARRWSALGGVTRVLAGSPRAGWSAVALATRIQNDPRPLIDTLRDTIREHRAPSIVLPAVLGVTEDAAVHAQVQDALGIPVGEALGVPPSLPGWRLHRALRRVLANANVTVIENRVVAAHRANDRVNEVTLADGDAVRARTYVLATGKYAAGGIEANGRFREPALDCPVWIDHLGDAFDEPEPLILTDADRTEDQPLLFAGVHADAEHQPIDRNGDVVYSNVFVAGTVRAGWSAAHYALGDAAQDGWNAGARAVRT